MATRPVPIVIISVAILRRAVLAALEAGAVDFLQKPTALATDRLLEVSDELVAKVKAAAGAKLWRVPPSAAPAAALAPSTPHGTIAARRTDVVVMGISTGGPQALKALIPQFPADFPVPIAMVLHMPVGYTELYARKLNELSQLRVKEAEEGDLIEAGSAYLAPAGRHLSFRKRGAGVVAHLDIGRSTPRTPTVRRAVPVGTLIATARASWSGDDRHGRRWPRGRA